MDLGTILDSVVKAERLETLKTSPQLTLGEIILKLEPISDEDGDKKVWFDFEYAFPTNLESWRGSYSELALGFDFSGYGFGDVNKDTDAPTIKKLLDELKSAIGKEFTGWKGGEYLMSKNTPVWVGNPGNSGNTAIVDVIDKGWKVVLKTDEVEY